MFLQLLLTTLIWGNSLGLSMKPDFKVITDCVFNGRKYSEGSAIRGACEYIVCEKGKWVAARSLEKKCEECDIRNDPYISTFDMYPGTTPHHYEHHRHCNYSASQIGTSYKPKSAVYTDFKPCSANTGSCVDVSVFADTPNTIITYKHYSSNPWMVNINGMLITVTWLNPSSISTSSDYQFLIWKTGNCVSVQGTKGYLVKFCYASVEIWAHSSLEEKVHGLCGTYNGVIKDDFTDRSSQVHNFNTIANTIFTQSWWTLDQNDRECPIKEEWKPEMAKDVELAKPRDTPCNEDKDLVKKYEKLCREELERFSMDPQYERNIALCIKDLCACTVEIEDCLEMQVKIVGDLQPVNVVVKG